MVLVGNDDNGWPHIFSPKVKLERQGREGGREGREVNQFHYTPP